MLDMRFIRAHPEVVRQAIAHKRLEADLDGLLALDDRRRAILAEVEQLKATKNRVSREIGQARKAGHDAAGAIAEMKRLDERVTELDDELRTVERRRDELLLWIPNLPHDSVPVGADEADDREVRRWGEPPEFGFEARPHWEIGAELDVLDFERGAKVAGSRFPLYKGLGARLERALINWFLDVATTEHGYQEVFPPFVANTEAMVGTAQLPKLAADMFRLAGDGMWLIPTAEVPLTNLHRDEILPPGSLPRYYCAYSACFRAEAGAAGRDTRGLVRVHQFNKVELVKFVEPHASFDELETLVNNAEVLLRRLGLPHRVVVLCTGSMSFASAKTYDLEVWLPSSGRYREISSCSNFTDFQARRAQIRYRPAAGASPEFAHTLNGSGLAVGRTVAAILENFQQADGTVRVPDVLVPYMGGVTVIGRSGAPAG